MREIILDTETTGLSPISDRLVEIGAIELFNHIPTGRHFHYYLKPDVPMSPEAQQVHGLSLEFLADKPAFASIADELVAFLGDAPIVAHNAGFDMSFVNAELQRSSRAPIPNDRVVDTLVLARRRHPAGPNSLDALCTRYSIDLSRRTVHGALLDASLLAEVYIELIGGRQASFGLDSAEEEVRVAAIAGADPALARVPRQGVGVTLAEFGAHSALIERLGTEPLWHSYLKPNPAAAATA
jgi:DNA polymerase-3 subunit epsilon